MLRKRSDMTKLTGGFEMPLTGSVIQFDFHDAVLYVWQVYIVYFLQRAEKKC
jgi:hypothetical protein